MFRSSNSRTPDDDETELGRSQSQNVRHIQRPNRFRGWPSHWRFFTAAERRVADSLDRPDAENLSIHLYNAYKLTPKAEMDRGSHAAGVKYNTRNYDWPPSAQWTAWPMDHNTVPREDGPSLGNFVKSYNQRAPKTSQLGSAKALEDALMVFALQAARRRFWAREWQSDSGSEDDVSDLQIFEEMSRDPSLKSQFHARRRIRNRRHYAPRTADTKGSEMNEPGSGRPPLGSPSTGVLSTSLPGSQMTIGNRRTIRPVPIHDDEISVDILGPSVRHMLSDLEALFLALHRTRQKYSRKQRKTKFCTLPQTRRPSTSGSLGTDISYGLDSQKSLPPSTPASDERTPDRHTPLHREQIHTSDSSEVSEENSKSCSRRRASSRHIHYYPRDALTLSAAYRMLALRDWSDIVGIAALQGWDSAVIERTERRCRALFKENMDFQTLSWPRDPLDKSEKKNGDEWETSSEKAMEAGVHVDGFMKPVKSRRGWKGKHKEKGNWKSKLTQKHVEGKPEA